MSVLLAWILAVFAAALLVEVLVWRRRAAKSSELAAQEAAENAKLRPELEDARHQALEAATATAADAAEIERLKTELANSLRQLSSATAATPSGRPRDAQGRYLKLAQA